MMDSTRGRSGLMRRLMARLRGLPAPAVKGCSSSCVLLSFICFLFGCLSLADFKMNCLSFMAQAAKKVQAELEAVSGVEGCTQPSAMAARPDMTPLRTLLLQKRRRGRLRVTAKKL
ncbi:unnamed protein product [Cuscuta epithymum]|uniref:Uncharacterized protein n=1 Tax=Cuscuta epithymum TaxID=186058 RepID=A0AAV0DSB4_9ASTE|nr:unnamed protein product [Cuscuta epithymum]